MTDNYTTSPASPPNSASDVLPDEISEKARHRTLRELYRTPKHSICTSYPRYNDLVAEGKLPITSVLVENKGPFNVIYLISEKWNTGEIPDKEKDLIMTTFEYVTYHIIFDKSVKKNETLVLDLLVKLFGPTYTDELYDKYVNSYKFEYCVIVKWKNYLEKYGNKSFAEFDKVPELEKKDREQRTMADFCVFPEGNIVGSN